LLYRQLGTLKLYQLFRLTLGAVIMLLLLSSAFNSAMSSATGCKPLEQFSRNLTEKEYLKFIEEQELPVQENIGFLVFMGLAMGLVVIAVLLLALAVPRSFAANVATAPSTAPRNICSRTPDICTTIRRQIFPP